MSQRPDQILQALGELWRERNAVYKDNWKHTGSVLASFFPEGVELKTPTDFLRMSLFTLMVVKMTRYTNNWQQGHSDSLRDTSVYSSILEHVDEIMREGGSIFETETEFTARIHEAPVDDWPCHKLPKERWCDHRGPAGFMGHTCKDPIGDNSPLRRHARPFPADALRVKPEHVDCPCWATGTYKRTEGCQYHPHDL